MWEEAHEQFSSHTQFCSAMPTPHVKKNRLGEDTVDQECSQFEVPEEKEKKSKSKVKW